MRTNSNEIRCLSSQVWGVDVLHIRVGMAALNVKGVTDLVEKRVRIPIEHMAAAVEAQAKRSIGNDRSEPSAPGEPPNMKTNTLRQSIQYEVESSKLAVVGPTQRAWYGEIHEFGGTLARADGGVMRFPKRPFMRPALEYLRANMLVRFFKDFLGSANLIRRGETGRPIGRTTVRRR